MCVTRFSVLGKCGMHLEGAGKLLQLTVINPMINRKRPFRSKAGFDTYVANAIAIVLNQH
jgi:hypothetical protein